MLNRLASLAMTTSVLKALPGKLDIKRHSPSILYIQVLVQSYKSQSLSRTCETQISKNYLYTGLSPGLEVIKLEYNLRLKIKRNDWLLADTCPQAANHCALF